MKMVPARHSVFSRILQLGLLLLLAEGSYRLVAFIERPIDFDVGPNADPYLQGFTDSEERPPVTFRWTGERASVAVPLETDGGPGTLLLRYGRFLEDCARVHVLVQNERAGSFEACSGRFRNKQLLVHFRSGPLKLDFVIEDPDPENLGIAMDWMRIEGARAGIPVRFWPPRLLLVSIFFLCLLSRLSLRASWAAGLGFITVQAIWFIADPFAMVHVSHKVVLSTPLLGLAVVGLLRTYRSPKLAWILFIFLAGYLLKAAGVFHPSYFYMDVTTHRRYVTAFAKESGSLAERGVAAQKRSGIAYPRSLGDRNYAFPYSPLFYVPFARLPGRRTIEDAHKHLASAAAASEVLLVFWLAGLWLGPGRGWAAALLAAISPPMYSRLFLAMWPTVMGHALDLLVIMAATAAAARPGNLRYLAGFGLTTLVSLLAYVSSLFNLGAFAGILSLLTRRVAFISHYFAAAVVTVIALYLPFLTEAVTQLWTTGLGAAGGRPSDGLLTALWRVSHFYGYAAIALAIPGIVILYRKTKPHVRHIVSSYLSSFAVLLTLRAATGTFKDLKEILYVGPLMAIAAGASIDTVYKKGRAGKIAAAAMIAGLILFWAIRYREFLEPHITFAGLP
jgi:hypothetical protein